MSGGGGLRASRGSPARRAACMVPGPRPPLATLPTGPRGAPGVLRGGRHSRDRREWDDQQAAADGVQIVYLDQDAALDDPALPATSVDSFLASVGLRRVWVAADGDSTFRGLVRVAGPEIAERLGRPATVDRIREHLAGVLGEDFARGQAGRPTRYAQLIPRRDGETAPQAFDRPLATISTAGGWTAGRAQAGAPV